MSGPLEHWDTDGALALSLSARLAGAPRLRQVTEWPAGLEPVGQQCHANADRWAAAHPTWRVLRGWVLFANEPFAGARYAAHSVVEDPAGVLWDVTLTDNLERGFLAHLGDLGEYRRLVATRWAFVCEPLGCDDEPGLIAL